MSPPGRPPEPSQPPSPPSRSGGRHRLGGCTDAAHCTPAPLLYTAARMPIDITTLTEAELLDLNRRIVERLELIRSARQLTQLAHFSVGMEVELATDDGRTIRGTVARLNRQTATVVAPQGSWRVSPSLLRPASGASPRIVPMPDRSGRR